METRVQFPYGENFFYDKEIENIKINNELEDKEKKLNPNKI